MVSKLLSYRRLRHLTYLEFNYGDLFKSTLKVESSRIGSYVTSENNYANNANSYEELDALTCKCIKVIE